MKAIARLLLLIGFLYSFAGASQTGDRNAFPIYTRTLRPARPTIVIVQPPPLPPSLAQEQRPYEELTRRHLIQEELILERLRAEQQAREAEIAGYTHMYGTSDLYGGLENR